MFVRPRKEITNPMQIQMWLKSDAYHVSQRPSPKLDRQNMFFHCHYLFPDLVSRAPRQLRLCLCQQEQRLIHLILPHLRLMKMLLSPKARHYSQQYTI